MSITIVALFALLFQNGVYWAFFNGLVFAIAIVSAFLPNGWG